MLTRRTFLTASSAALATRLFAAPKDSKTPNPELEKLGGVALAEAKKQKATYADIRIVRITDQRLGMRLSPERGTFRSVMIWRAMCVVRCKLLPTWAIRAWNLPDRRATASRS